MAHLAVSGISCELVSVGTLAGKAAHGVLAAPVAAKVVVEPTLVQVLDTNRHHTSNLQHEFQEYSFHLLKLKYVPA